MTREEFYKTIKELFPHSIIAHVGLDEQIVIYTGLTIDSDNNINPKGA